MASEQERTWWEVPYGAAEDKPSGFVQVRAATSEEALELAREQLVDFGVLPGPMHDAFRTFVEKTS